VTVNENSAAQRYVTAQRVLYVLLSIAAAISIGRGLQDAVMNSQDMQWRPLVVFWRDGLDPYQLSIQAPNSPEYTVAPYLYLIFFPLAPLAFVSFGAAKILWAVANIAFLAGTLWIFHKHKNIGMPLALALIFLCATPTRNTFGNAQISLFSLFFFALYVKYAERRPLLAAMFASLGSAKYSLGVPLFFQMRLTPWSVAAFVTIPLAAVVYWCLHFQMGFIEALFQPVRVATFTVGPRVGVGDFLMLVRDAGLPPFAAYAVAAAVLIAAVLYQRTFLATEDRLLCFAFYTMLSLWLVYHGGYDFVFLLPVAIAAMRSRNGIVRNGLLAGTAYFWFLTKALSDFLSFAPPLEFNLAILVLMQLLIAWEIRMHAAAAQPAIEARALRA